MYRAVQQHYHREQKLRQQHQYSDGNQQYDDPEPGRDDLLASEEDDYADFQSALVHLPAAPSTLRSEDATTPPQTAVSLPQAVHVHRRYMWLPIEGSKADRSALARGLGPALEFLSHHLSLGHSVLIHDDLGG